MSTFEHDGETLWYDVQGSGLPLVVVHGGLGLDHTYLRPAFDLLADQIQVIYLDLRANGRSTGDGEGMTMAQLSDDVEALRAHLGLDRMALFGHSYGGFVALQHALDHGDRLTHLLLCDTDAAGPSEEVMEAGLRRIGLDLAVLEPFETPIRSREDLLRVFHAVEPAYFPHSPPGSSIAGLADTIPREEGTAGGETALEGWDVTGRLGEVTAPTLVLSGADDFMFPPDRAQAMAAAIPGAQCRIFDTCGHLPHVEAAEHFLDAVRDFLAGPTGPGERPGHH